MKRKATPQRPSEGDVYEALGFARTATERLAAARLRGLRNLAHHVWVGRHNPVMRPHLRAVIRCVRAARNALRAGNIYKHEAERDRARMHMAFGREGKRHKALKVQAHLGGDATAELFAQPDLDELIDGCINRGDRMRTKVWAEDFKLTPRAVQGRIQRRKDKAKTQGP